MSKPMLTRLFILFLLVAALAWTGYMLIVDPQATISQQMYEMATKSGPKGLALVFLCGFVAGHFWFSGSYEKCNKCGEKI